jgi:hypothetical protein
MHGSDTPLSLLRTEAGISPGDGDNRDIDAWENVGGCAQDDHRLRIAMNSANRRFFARRSDYLCLSGSSSGLT